jgi:hypothetical protein
MMLDPIGLFLPCDLLERVMGIGNNLVTSSEIRLFVFKHVVTNSHNHGFVEVWPGSKYSLANMLRRDRFGSSPLSFGRSDGNDHTLISRVGLEDAHTVVAKCTIVWECVKGWETSQSAGTDTDPLDETENEINTIAKCRKVEWRSSSSGMSQVGEEARLRRRVVFVTVFVKSELSAQDSRLIPSFLFVGQANIPGCCQSRIAKMTYEP